MGKIPSAPIISSCPQKQTGFTKKSIILLQTFLACDLIFTEIFSVPEKSDKATMWNRQIDHKSLKGQKRFRWNPNERGMPAVCRNQQVANSRTPGGMKIPCHLPNLSSPYKDLHPLCKCYYRNKSSLCLLFEFRKTPPVT